jgi:hypothetical protein
MGRRIGAMVLAAATVLLPAAANATPSTPQHAYTVAPTSSSVAQVVRLSAAPNPARPGQRVTITGSGCHPHQRVQFYWHVAVNPVNTDPLPPTTARADGTFQTTWALPQWMGPGRFTIVAVCDRHGRGAQTILTVAHTTTSTTAPGG